MLYQLQVSLSTRTVQNMESFQNNTMSMTILILKTNDIESNLNSYVLSKSNMQ